jgi:hypothetical protein
LTSIVEAWNQVILQYYLHSTTETAYAISENDISSLNWSVRLTLFIKFLSVMSECENKESILLWPWYKVGSLNNQQKKTDELK